MLKKGVLIGLGLSLVFSGVTGTNYEVKAETSKSTNKVASSKTTSTIYKEILRGKKQTKTGSGVIIKGTRLERYIQYNLLEGKVEISLKQYNKLNKSKIKKEQLIKSSKVIYSNYILKSIVINSYSPSKDKLVYEVAIPKNLIKEGVTHTEGYLTKRVKIIEGQSRLQDKYMELFNSTEGKYNSKTATGLSSDNVKKETLVTLINTGNANRYQAYEEVIKELSNRTGLPITYLNDSHDISDDNEDKQKITGMQYYNGYEIMVTDNYLSGRYFKHTGVKGYFNNIPKDTYLNRHQEFNKLLKEHY